MEPACTIIRRLGGPEAVSSALGLAYTAPYRWQYPKAKGGTGGLIPQRHHLALMRLARERGVPLEPADFFPVEEGLPEPPAIPVSLEAAP